MLLVTSSIIGCGSAPSGQPGGGPPASPREKPFGIPGYPEGPPVAQGIVQKVTANTLDLEVAIGGTAHGSGGETKVVLVVFHPDIKVYELVHQTGAMPELKELTLSDLEEGEVIRVWGEESGDRISATIIITGMPYGTDEKWDYKT